MIAVAASAQTEVKQELRRLNLIELIRGVYVEDVALNGSTALASGSRFAPLGSSITGFVRVYDVTTGEFHFELLPDGASGEASFGVSVAVSGANIVVGAPFESDNGSSSGSIYVFDATTGERLLRLLPNDNAEGDQFGSTVAVSGTIAVVGAPRDIDKSVRSGSAYVFDITTGQQLHKLLPNDGAADDSFGRAVAINGKTAVVGALGSSRSAAYVFDLDSGQQLFKLLPGDPTGGFATTVALNDSMILVGSSSDDDNGVGSGSVYVFDKVTGQQLFKLLASDGASRDLFGSSVAVDGNVAVVAAAQATGYGFDGAAYIFDLTTKQELFKLIPSDDPDTEFGESVAVDKGTVVVGARDSFTPIISPAIGAAYVYNIQSATTSADLNGDGCVNQTDLAKLLGAWGTADLNADGLSNAADLAFLLGSWDAGCF